MHGPAADRAWADDDTPATLLTLGVPTMSLVRSDGDVHRDVMWVSLDERIFEHVQVRGYAGGFTADGVVLRPGGGDGQRIRYRVEADRRWNVRRVTLSRMDDDGPPAVVLTSDGEGRWTDGAGQARPDLDGCRDVDIQASPFTNTLAIRRLGLAAGASAEIRAVYVAVPELAVRAFRQRYTLLQVGAAGATYRYESLESGFRADLPVDEDGLLLEYPGYFRRAGAART
jgi:hypothetical protein